MNHDSQIDQFTTSELSNAIKRTQTRKSKTNRFGQFGPKLRTEYRLEEIKMTERARKERNERMRNNYPPIASQQKPFTTQNSENNLRDSPSSTNGHTISHARSSSQSENLHEPSLPISLDNHFEINLQKEQPSPINIEEEKIEIGLPNHTSEESPLKSVRSGKFNLNNTNSTKEESKRKNKKFIGKASLLKKKIVPKKKTGRTTNQTEENKLEPPFFDLATTPHDGKDPHIYSMTIPTPPLSFDTITNKFSAKAPPPTYFKKEELPCYKKVKKEDFLEGFEIRSDGALKCVDKDILQKQKGILANLLKQVISKGGVVNVSLPCRIFESRSGVERITDFWRFAPTFLTKAAHISDKIERFRLVISFAVAGMYCSTQQLKPFNPLLGETLQGSFSDGTKVIVEHTSHHPPISNFSMYGANNMYKFHGYHEFVAKMKPTYAKGQQKGPNRVIFPDGQEIVFYYPFIHFGGLIMGDRTAYFTGDMIFEDRRNNMRSVICFDFSARKISLKKGIKKDDIMGIMYKADFSKTVDKEIKDFNDLKDVVEHISKIEGSWLSHLLIDDRQYWNIDTFFPNALQYENQPLPSDWRFREDLLWLRRKNVQYADEWKVKLEIQQRRDRAGREAFAKTQKKK